jgi:hypothetical protein
MLKLRVLLTSFLLFPAIIHAQAPATTIQSHTEGSGVVVGFIGGASFSSKNPGLPFSADVIEETDKVLADGNRIHRQSHGKFYRDSQGRVRTETELSIAHASAPILHVVITDPVERQFIMLDLTNKTAIISHFPWSLSTSGSSESPAQIQPTTPALAMRDSRLAAVKSQSTATGTETREIEGFTVSLMRHTRTVPAGEKGNDKPLISTNESWYSKDLAIALLTTTENPESGKFVHKLVNIHTGDPDPLLFQVPADFTVKEMPQK